MCGIASIRRPEGSLKIGYDGGVNPSISPPMPIPFHLAPAPRFWSEPRPESHTGIAAVTA